MQSGKSISVIAVTMLAALAAASVMAQSAHDAHAAHSHATQAEAPAPARRWATDAPLRAGMRRIRQAVQALDHYQHGHMDATQAANTATLIDAAVADMIATCKLKPDADAALHGLLVQFIGGANAVRAGKLGKAEMAAMQAALARYPQLFDDADWGKPAG